MAVEDLDWLIAAVGPALIAATHRRRLELGLDEDVYERGLSAVRERWLANGGQPSARNWARRCVTAGLPAGYSVERHLLYRAALEGLICMGPDRGAKPTFVLLEKWLGRPLERGRRRKRSAGWPHVTWKPTARRPSAISPSGPGCRWGCFRAGWEAGAGRCGRAEAWARRHCGCPAQRLTSSRRRAAESGRPVVRLLPAFRYVSPGPQEPRLILDDEHAGASTAAGA